MPTYVGNRREFIENGSWDNGKTWKDEKCQKLFATYFFLSEDYNKFHLNAFTILDLIADFGGFAQCMVVTFGFIGLNINN